MTNKEKLEAIITVEGREVFRAEAELTWVGLPGYRVTVKKVVGEYDFFETQSQIPLSKFRKRVYDIANSQLGTSVRRIDVNPCNVSVNFRAYIEKPARVSQTAIVA